MAFRAVSALSGASPQDPGKPTGTATSDVLIAIVRTGDVVVTPPANWTLIRSDVITAVIAQKSYRALGDVASTSFSWASGNGEVVIHALSGRDTAAPITAHNGTTTNATTTITAPTVTAALGDDLVCGWGADDTEAHGAISDATVTERASVATTERLSTGTKDNLSAGATGSITRTSSPTASDVVGQQIVVKAAAAVTVAPRRWPQQLPNPVMTAPQPQTTGAWIAVVVSVTRTGPIPVDPQPLPVYPKPADQPRHTEASWMKGVIDATLAIIPPTGPQALPPPPWVAMQPRHVEAGWMKTVIDATRAVVPWFPVPPLPVPLMVAAQPLFEATAPASAQPAPTTFVPLVNVPPLPPRPWIAAQPAPNLAWIAQIITDRPFPPWPQPSLGPRPPAAQPIFLASWIAQIVSDFPLPIGPQPLPPRPWVPAQPIASAAWAARIVSDFSFTPWRQPLLGPGRTSPDRVSTIAAWAQLFEGGFPLLRWPQPLAIPPPTAGQPLVDAAVIVDQGQPAPSAIVLRSWPQPLPLAAFTSPDRAELIAAVAQVLEGGIVLAQRVPRNPAGPWVAAQPLFDPGFIADQGQPSPTLFVPRSRPQPLPQPPLIGQQPRVFYAPLSTGGHACFVLTDRALAGFVLSDTASVGMAMTESVAAAFLLTLLALANYVLTDVPSAALTNSEKEC